MKQTTECKFEPRVNGSHAWETPPFWHALGQRGRALETGLEEAHQTFVWFRKEGAVGAKDETKIEDEIA